MVLVPSFLYAFFVLPKFGDLSSNVLGTKDFEKGLVFCEILPGSSEGQVIHSCKSLPAGLNETMANLN